MAKRKEWERIVAAQKGSGLTPAEYCRKHSLREGQFCYWRKVLQKQANNGFVQIGGSVPLEIAFSDGVFLRVAVGFDEQLLKRVVEVLRA